MSIRFVEHARLAFVGALATALIAPGVAFAAPGNGPEQRASHKPTAEPSPQGKEHHGTAAEPAGKPSPKATPTRGKGAASAPGQVKKSNEPKGDPAGNNGTIKIDYPAPADSGHANRPHPGCSFQLRMFNFDNDQYGSLTITGQSPTRTGALLTRRILLSDDAAGGGQDVDAVYSFTAAELGLADVPQAKQGWHLKVAVNAENAPGGAKQKVFWLSCPTSQALAPHAIVRRPALVLGRAQLAEVTTESAPARVTEELVSANAEVGPDVLSFLGGGGLLRGSSLPFTGLMISMLLAGAGACIVLGGLSVAASRRRGPSS